MLREKVTNVSSQPADIFFKCILTLKISYFITGNKFRSFPTCFLSQNPKASVWITKTNPKVGENKKEQTRSAN